MIKILSQDLINKIAAGEVVERPASVVKELTENAVDAGASSIEIILEEGGVKLIKVGDNGMGMSEEDAKLCLLRHATSKIDSVEDLFNINTLGFRGEALASIAAVSQFSLLTKQPESAQGVRVGLDEKHEVLIQPAAAQDGSSVSIRNLFYNVPARQKFLKTAQTEYTHILRYLQQFALIHPDLELKLQHNKKLIFHYQSSDWAQRVEKVLGKTFYSKLIPLAEQQSEVPIKGFIAKAELVHATHKNQYLFVNGRPVYDHLVNRAVLEGYGTLVPKGYFPAFVIRIDVDPQMVDVNVHPRKSEVKFVSPSLVIKFVKEIVRKSLASADLASEKTLPSTGSDFLSFEKGSASHSTSKKIGKSIPSSFPRTSGTQSKPSQKQVKQALAFSQSFSGGVQSLKKSPLEENDWNILGQMHLSFILVETLEGLLLFDQHAVSEITNYHRLMKERENGEICSQQLLLPFQVELTAEEQSIIEENREVFIRLGWEIDQLGERSYQISALPEILKVNNIEENIHDLLSQLKEEKDLDMTERELAILKYEACRGAIMFGDALTLDEMKGLLNQWHQVENNAACEHGRPALARITIEEMRKFFKR